MKTGRTIQEMAVEIMRQSKAKEDYLVNTGSLVMEVWTVSPCSICGMRAAVSWSIP